ncbi:MAG: RNA methyltransferase [Cyanobacteria bacterium P01_D01_bin.73]
MGVTMGTDFEEGAALGKVRIVLVQPAGPRNVGSVARVMANFGLSNLVLVAPQCDHLGQEARTMAVHAAEILERATVVRSLPDALAGCQRVAATLGREFAGRVPVEAIAQVSPWLLAQELTLEQRVETNSALIFGREDHGLSNDDFDYAQRLVTIPTGAEYVSLNLAQAVGVCAYELSQAASGNARQQQAGAIAPEAQPVPKTAGDIVPDFEQLEGFYGDLEKLLLDVGYLYPHTAGKRMKTFRNLLHRSHPTAREVAMLRGILRQMRWAVENSENAPQP